MELADLLGTELGTENVTSSRTELERQDYFDRYPVGDADEFAPRIAVRPGNLDQIRAVLRIAQEENVPVWTFSRGRNNGYGGSGPRAKGSITLDLSRMNKVLDIDTTSGTALLEPGVRFRDLYPALREIDAPFWPSVPDLDWGSVIGNALDRGIGYTALGEHFENLCGLEVMLPDGEVVRTGMGAMTGSRSWNIYRPGFGPAVDGLFSQSNLGIVTKANVWLMPKPERWAIVDIALDSDEQLARVTDVLRPLRFDGTIASTISAGTAGGVAAMLGTRDQWVSDGSPLPADFEQRVMSAFGVAAWNMRFSLYGTAIMLAARIEQVKTTLERQVPGARVTVMEYDGDAPLDEVREDHRTRAGIPGMYLEQMAGWSGGRGGHIAVSPVAPFAGEETMRLTGIVKPRFEEYGFDWLPSYHSRGRHMLMIGLILYNRDDADQSRRARELSRVLIQDLAREGYGEYRAHVALMDEVAASYDWNEHALSRFHTRLKDALDPNGILSPGKQGVWATASIGVMA
ncbi:FAD-binding oxidoreductase [Arthrobacter sp. CAL618]|uniref:FAD-binding oxidoreductase n=1 Tax=Arthrobacter sp. CAL618 TaxID=1055770 RepID=UPI00041EB803|nr:FAD-binding oxidoreductase [Arthrobacter sp. CAL618]